MTSNTTHTEALVTVANRWRNPEHPPRAEAVEQTLNAPNRYTEEALAFALNAVMQQIVEEGLSPVEKPPEEPLTIGVLPYAGWPMSGLADMLRVVRYGHRFLGVPHEADPALLPAFVEEVRSLDPAFPAVFVERMETLLTHTHAVIGTVEDEEALQEWVERLREQGFPHYLRMPGIAVAILSGKEDVETRGALAEDLLLYEGQSHRNVRIIWAPEELTPDPYLDILAQFRGWFPAHPDTDGALALARAFLEALDVPRAYGPGFLISKGKPEVQQPGHIRWATYRSPEEVQRWLRTHAEEVDIVVADADTLSFRPEAEVVLRPGEVHRLPWYWEPEGWDTDAFIQSLSEVR